MVDAAAGAGRPSRISTRAGFVDVVAAALLFATNGTVSKFALSNGLSSMQLVQARSLGAAVAMMSFLAVTRPASLRTDRRELGFLLVAGIVGIGLVQWLYFVTIGRLPVGIGLLLEFLAPVFVLLWVRFVRREQVRPRMWWALVLCVGGLALVAQVWDGLTLDGIGVLAGLGAAVALAAYYLTSEHGLVSRDPLSLAGWTFSAAALFWLLVRPPWSFPWQRLDDAVVLSGPLPWTVPLWALVVWVVVLGTVVPYALILRGLRHLGSARTGLIGMAEPVLAATVAWWVLDEQLAVVQVLGGAVVLVGIVAAETARSSRRTAQPPVPGPILP